MLNSRNDVAFAATYGTRFHRDVSRAYAVFQFVIYYHLSIIYTYYTKHDSFKHTRKRTFSKALAYARPALAALFEFKANAQPVDSPLSSGPSESSSASPEHMLTEDQSASVTPTSGRKRKVRRCSEPAQHMLILCQTGPNPSSRFKSSSLSPSARRYFICSAYVLLIFLLGLLPTKRPKKAPAEGQAKKYR
jgi:hypothetical protein